MNQPETVDWLHGIHLFTLTTTNTVGGVSCYHEFPVFWWPEYGVVCPNYVTTNGSAGTLLAAVRPNFGLLPGLLHPQSVDALSNVLMPWVHQQRAIERDKWKSGIPLQQEEQEEKKNV